MKKLVRFLLFGFAAIVALFFGAFLWLTQQAPDVAIKPGVHFSDLKRIQSLAREFRPSNLIAENRYVVTLSQRELSLAPIAALTSFQLARDVNFDVMASDNDLHVVASIPVVIAGWKRWLNVSLSFDIRPGKIPVQRNSQIGPLALPEYLNHQISRLWLERIPSEYLEIWKSSLVSFNSVERGVHIAFTWNPLATTVLPDLYPQSQQYAAKAILDVLEGISATGVKRLPLNQFFQQLLLNWQPRASDLNVLMVVLSQYISGNSIGELYAFDSRESAPIRLYLSGRQDLSRHFLLSAMLASQVGESVAGELGYMKELSDADNKASGFSVADLLANKAGILFYQKLSEAVNNGTLNEFVEDLYLPLLHEQNDLDALDVLPQTWDDVALSRVLRQLPFYSIKSIPSRHR